MMQNMKCYCRQRTEALEDKLCFKPSLVLKILLFRVQVKSHMIHFQI